MKSMRIKQRVLCMVVAVVALSIFVFPNPCFAEAKGLYFEPEYAKDKTENSVYMNYYFQEFLDLQWGVTTLTEMEEYLKSSNLPYEIEESENGRKKYINIGVVTKGSFNTELYIIHSDYLDIHINYVTLNFEKEGKEFFLTGADLISTDSINTLRKYYTHFYELEVEYDNQETHLLSLGADYFSIMFVPLGKEGDTVTMIEYLITPDHIYVGD